MGLFGRTSSDRPTAVPAAADNDERFVLEAARSRILPGFSTLADARAAIVELVADDDDLRVTPERAVAIVESVWERRVGEQASWTDLSDADRVAAAFSELEASGIVARMCFT